MVAGVLSLGGGQAGAAATPPSLFRYPCAGWACITNVLHGGASEAWWRFRQLTAIAVTTHGRRCTAACWSELLCPRSLLAA